MQIKNPGLLKQSYLRGKEKLRSLKESSKLAIQKATRDRRQPHQHTTDGIVLAGRNPFLVSGGVLRGLPEVKIAIASAVIKHRISALQEALNYGDEGLNLVIQCLKDSSRPVQQTAYQLLRERSGNLTVKKALLEYNPYFFFECIHTIEVRSNNHFHNTALSLDRKILAIGSDYTIKLWNPDTAKLLRTLGKHSHLVSSIAISPDGKNLVSGGDDCTLKLWNLHTGKLLRTFTGYLYKVTSLAISPDGNTIASGHWNTINLWNLHTGKLVHTLEEHPGWIDSVAFSSDGQKIITRSSQSLKIWGEKL